MPRSENDVHQRGHAGRERIVVEDVVADPVFEQVAEDEHRVGAVGGVFHEMLERGDRLRIASLRCRSEKQERACGLRVFALARHARGDARGGLSCNIEVPP